MTSYEGTAARSQQSVGFHAEPSGEHLPALPSPFQLLDVQAVSETNIGTRPLSPKQTNPNTIASSVRRRLSFALTRLAQVRQTFQEDVAWYRTS